MNFLHILLRLTILGFFGGLWLLAGVYLYLSPNLPDVETLRDVKLQTPMRVRYAMHINPMLHQIRRIWC